MQYKVFQFSGLGVKVELSLFGDSSMGVADYFVMLHVEARGETFEQQMQRLYAAQEQLTTIAELQRAKVITKRYFLTDAINQQPLMRNEECDVCFIQQPLLDGSKIAALIYLQEGTKVNYQDGFTIAEHNGYSHLWKMNMIETKGDSEAQTQIILEKYEESLSRFDATIEKNCIRTWFFVRDVDTQYAGMVKARRENFDQQGLTQQTHYIASTGIGGGPILPTSVVQMGAYAVAGIEREQITFLYAPNNFNRTSDYGVTFERGTQVDYGDRRKVYVSGTASIDNKGNVVYPNDIVRQTNRMIENVEALLTESETTFKDVAHIIVYLRDLADYDVVYDIFEKRFPDIPRIIVLAPVCRPAWLVEMECVAIKAQNDSRFRNF